MNSTKKCTTCPKIIQQSQNFPLSNLRSTLTLLSFPLAYFVQCTKKIKGSWKIDDMVKPLPILNWIFAELRCGYCHVWRHIQIVFLNKCTVLSNKMAKQNWIMGDDEPKGSNMVFKWTYKKKRHSNVEIHELACSLVQLLMPNCVDKEGLPRHQGHLLRMKNQMWNFKKL